MKHVLERPTEDTESPLLVDYSFNDGQRLPVLLGQHRNGNPHAPLAIHLALSRIIERELLMMDASRRSSCALSMLHACQQPSFELSLHFSLPPKVDPERHGLARPLRGRFFGKADAR